MALNFRALQDTLRERLLTFIAAGELTGLQLARDTGFQQAHISNFLNRKRGLSLEAMDAILRATNLSLSELLPKETPRRLRDKNACGECSRYVSIPIVEEAECVATQVPKREANQTLKIASSLVQRLEPQMATPRQHWQRFVAIRVKAADVEAMGPRLPAGSVVVIDRHYNDLTPWRQTPNMYVVKTGSQVLIRYVEALGPGVVLRALQPEWPLEWLKGDTGHGALASVVGRVCFVHQHV